MTDLTPLPADAPIPFSRWRHWKGDDVLVHSVVRHSETKEFHVVYTHLGELWVRPLLMWQDDARPGVPRFTRLPLLSDPTTDIYVEHRNG